jgi:hypothetical protein
MLIMFPDKKISISEGLIFVICVCALTIISVFEFNAHYLTEKYPLIFSIFSGIFSGILTAIVLLYFQEQHFIKRLDKYYSEIAGEYIRIDIGQDNATDAIIKNMQDQNVGLKIKLIHMKGTNSIKLKANYWTSENAVVEGTIEFNDKNGSTAYGRYRYTRASTGMLGHSGTYKIYRLEEDNTKLLVQFHHLFPRLQVNNPDANRGWEIWQKA